MTGAQFLNALALGQVTPGPVVQTGHPRTTVLGLIYKHYHASSSKNRASAAARLD